MLLLIERLSLSLATVVTVVSEATKQELGYGRALVIRNGVRIGATSPASRLALRASHNVSDKIVCVYAGRFSALKGIGLIFRAVSVVSRNDRLPVHLLMIGEDAPLEVQYAERLVREAGIADRVSFIVRPLQYPGILSAGDVFLLPSQAEGLPIALLEAMGCGLPPVATRVGGVPEVIRDGVDGLLVPLGDAEAFIASVRRLLRDGALRERLSRFAEQRVRREFTEDRMGEEYCDVYVELASALPEIP